MLTKVYHHSEDSEILIMRFRETGLTRFGQAVQETWVDFENDLKNRSAYKDSWPWESLEHAICDRMLDHCNVRSKFAELTGFYITEFNRENVELDIVYNAWPEFEIEIVITDWVAFSMWMLNHSVTAESIFPPEFENYFSLSDRMQP